MRSTRFWWKIFFVGQSWLFTKTLITPSRGRCVPIAMGWRVSFILAIAECKWSVRSCSIVVFALVKSQLRITLRLRRWSHSKPISAKCTRCADVGIGPKSKPFVRSIRAVCLNMLIAVRSARGLVPFFNKQNVRRLWHSYLVIIHRIEYDNNRFAQIIFLLVFPSLFARARSRRTTLFAVSVVLPFALRCGHSSSIGRSIGCLRPYDISFHFMRKRLVHECAPATHKPTRKRASSWIDWLNE